MKAPSPELKNDAQFEMLHSYLISEVEAISIFCFSYRGLQNDSQESLDHFRQFLGKNQQQTINCVKHVWMFIEIYNHYNYNFENHFHDDNYHFDDMLLILILKDFPL